jgi:hypothetical protein
MKILIIEGCEQLRLALKISLEHLGHSIVGDHAPGHPLPAVRPDADLAILGTGFGDESLLPVRARTLFETHGLRSLLLTNRPFAAAASGPGVLGCLNLTHDFDAFARAIGAVEDHLNGRPGTAVPGTLVLAGRPTGA